MRLLVRQASHKRKHPSADGLEAFTETVTETLKKGDKLTLVGFGTFDVQDVPARTGRNPRTGEVLQIKAKKKVRFKAGAELSGAVN